MCKRCLFFAPCANDNHNCHAAESKPQVPDKKEGGGCIEGGTVGVGTAWKLDLWQGSVQS